MATQTMQDRLLAWADSHDWGAAPAARVGTDAVEVSTQVRLATGEWIVERFIASSFGELRNWAGY